jgi:hypothetical protein
MSMHETDKSKHTPQKVDALKGYETSDVRVSGVLVAMVAFGLFAAVSAVVGYEIGKVLNARMTAEDEPPSKWARPVDVRPLGNMANNPELQKKMDATTNQFPTPKLQTDDGLQDLADLHAREDLLLENYSWVDRSQGKVRIPIARAMELIAQSGLPVAPQAEAAPLLTGATKPEITVPLTNGFTQTGFEQEEAQARALKSESKK